MGRKVEDSSRGVYQGIHSHRLYPNTLSSREMESLTPICDTLWPSIDHDSYYSSTSASMTETPQHVMHADWWVYVIKIATLGSGSASIEPVAVVYLVWDFVDMRESEPVMVGQLSIRAGEEIFSDPSPHTRGEILLSWSLSSFYLFRMLFKAIKFLTMLIFFSKVNQKEENPSWNAIGYCGPDPGLKQQTEIFHEQEQEQESGGETEEEQRFGSLYRAVLRIENHRDDALSEVLCKAGFPVSPSKTIRCDAVVVGSGSGGGVVAGVLATAGYKVVVLEKGNYYARSNLSLLEGPTMDHMYEGGGLLATDDLGVVVLAGSAVGGGSTINWSASIRTPEHVRSEWCNQYDLELFGSKAYEQALDAICERMGVQSRVDREGFNSAVLRKGCLELGYPVEDVPRNSPSDHDCGWCCFGCKDGRKKGTHETGLKDMADSSGNGIILSGCQALKVLHERNKGRRKRNVATGVLFQVVGVSEVYMVESKVTVVACGALCTPKLLKASGLRNAHIGKHLRLHPTVMAWGYFPLDEKKSYEGGIITAMSTVVANFKTSGYGAVIQTPALHPGMFSALTPWVSGMDMKERMSRYSRTAHLFALARDKGSGRVDLPKSLSYQLDGEDEENLRSGVEKMLKILVAAGAQEIGTHHCSGERMKVKKEEELERFIKEASGRALRDLSTPMCSAHQMGSCRMGVHPKHSAVDPKGETWEVEGLFVADTSVFPTALGVNPMVTVQAIAYCTAQSILQFLLASSNKSF